MIHAKPTRSRLEWTYELIWMLLALCMIKGQAYLPQFTLPMILPFQKISSEYAQQINQFWQNSFQSKELLEKYELLKKELDQAKLKQNDYQTLYHENIRLRNLLSFDDKRKDLTLYYAQVIHNQYDHINQKIKSLRLLLPQKEPIKNLKIGSAVLSQGSMIGVIDKIELPYLFVIPMNHPTMNLDIVLEKSRLRGVARGGSSASPHHIMSLEYLEKKRLAIVGERVISTGLDGKFPEGLVVGEVADRKIPTHGVFQIAHLKKNIEYRYLKEVAIVIGWPDRLK